MNWDALYLICFFTSELSELPSSSSSPQPQKQTENEVFNTLRVSCTVADGYKQSVKQT